MIPTKNGLLIPHSEVEIKKTTVGLLLVFSTYQHRVEEAATGGRRMDSSATRSLMPTKGGVVPQFTVIG